MSRICWTINWEQISVCEHRPLTALSDFKTLMEAVLLLTSLNREHRL
jgi:hypothetical protein